MPKGRDRGISSFASWIQDWVYTRPVTVPAGTYGAGDVLCDLMADLHQVIPHPFRTRHGGILVTDPPISNDELAGLITRRMVNGIEREKALLIDYAIIERPSVIVTTGAPPELVELTYRTWFEEFDRNSLYRFEVLATSRLMLPRELRLCLVLAGETAG